MMSTLFVPPARIELTSKAQESLVLSIELRGQFSSTTIPYFSFRYLLFSRFFAIIVRMESERDEITRKEFNEVIKLARANNRILRSIQRSSRVRKVFSVICFVFIIGVMFYFYYYFQPYIENMVSTYEFLFSNNGVETMIRESVENQIGNGRMPH